MFVVPYLLVTKSTMMSLTEFQNFLIVLDLPGSMNTASRRDAPSGKSVFNTYEEMGVQVQVLSC
jgi:hypothetical protein